MNYGLSKTKPKQTQTKPILPAVALAKAGLSASGGLVRLRQIQKAHLLRAGRRGDSFTIYDGSNLLYLY
jgi:hypothetical protein